MTAVSRNAYTDAPWLQDNAVTGSFRLLFWLFFHPSAWRNHLAHIDPTLKTDFSLADLRGWQWRQPELLRFLLKQYLAWPLLLGIGIALLLNGLAFPSQIVILGVILGVAAGIVASLLISVAGSVAISAPIGIAVGLSVGVVGSQVLGNVEPLLATRWPVPPGTLTTALMGLTAGLAGGLAYGVASGVSDVVQPDGTPISLLRQISGAIIGMVIGIGGGLMAGAVRGPLTSALIVGLPFGVAIGWRTQQWSKGIAAVLFMGAAGVLLGVQNGPAPVAALWPAVTYMALLTSLFVVPYVLAERIAGSGAGALAGALGSGGGFILFFDANAVYLTVLWFSLAGVLLGLTLAWWRPVVMYPFLVIWNVALLRWDERITHSTGERPLRFRLHSAFWDELQRLPLVYLDEHLLLALRQRPAEGEAALAYLRDGRQRWAAQRAQIELEARQLESCQTAPHIAAAHQRTSAGQLTGPASALLRSLARLSQDVDAALQQESAFNRRLALNAVEDRLDALLRELTRSTEPYAGRFRPIAEQWRQVINEACAALAAESELRQEIDNPYIIGVPLTEQQEIFVGRTAISARIEQLLLDRRRPPLLLYGQRRVGKTSLLNNLGRLLPSTIVPLFVDLQGPASRAQDEAGFLYNVARSMVRSAQAQRDLTLPPLSREQLFDDPFTRFDEWLDVVETALAPQVALLMLDEFEALEQVLANGRFDETVVLGMLRHLIQHRPRFKVLLAGSHTLNEFQRWASYLINVQVIHIGYLDAAEAQQLVTAPVHGFALQYEPAAAQRVQALTRGHPFLVQLLCAEIVARKNEQPPAQRRLATMADVETAVAPALQHGSFFFADVEQNQVDMVGREVLRLLAAAGEGTAVPRAQLVEYVPSLMALEQALRDLQHRELIEPAADGYRFQVELLRRWFASRT